MNRRYSPDMYPVQPQQYSGASPFVIGYEPTMSPEYKQLMYEGMQRMGERHDQAVQGIAQQVAQFGEMEALDHETIGNRLSEYQEEMNSLVKDYNYDYARAKTSIVKKMAKEAANPLWSHNREHVRQARLAEQMELQWGRENTLFENDPRDRTLGEIMKNPELAQARGVQAPDYIEVIKDTVGQIPSSHLGDVFNLNAHQIEGLIRYGTITGVDETTLERIAEAMVDPFKDRTPARTWDTREGYEWVHEDEEIKNRIMKTLNPQLHEKRQLSYMDAPQRDGGEDDTFTGAPTWVPKIEGAEGEQSIATIDENLELFKRLDGLLSGTEEIKGGRTPNAAQRLVDNPISKWWQHPFKYNLITQGAAFVSDIYDAFTDPLTKDSTLSFLGEFVQGTLTGQSSTETITNAATSAAQAMIDKVEEVQKEFPTIETLQTAYDLSLEEAMEVNRDYLVKSATVHHTRYPVKDSNMANNLTSIIGQSTALLEDTEYINSDGETKELKSNLKDHIANSKVKATGVSFSPSRGSVLLHTNNDGDAEDILLPADIFTESGRNLLTTSNEFFQELLKPTNLTEQFDPNNPEQFISQVEKGNIKVHNIGYSNDPTTSRLFAAATQFNPDTKKLESTIYEITPNKIREVSASTVANHVNNALYAETATTFKMKTDTF